MTENPYLSGNFAPVEGELTATDLPITGEVPRELTGRLLRIGPNPIAPNPENHHWFLGNGMVHGVKLEEGRPLWYRRRFVRDDELTEAFGWPQVPGPVNGELGGGGANTNVIGHAGRTFAIVEAGNLPVELSEDLETVTRSDFDGTLPGGFTAHPKKNPSTGELHALAYSPFLEYVQMVVVGTDGRVRRTVDIPMDDKPMIHDCAITKNYFIILDLPVVLDETLPERGVSFPFGWQEGRPARVGLLPHDGTAADVVWAEVNPCYVFHPLNAYEDAQGRVVLDVVRHPKMFATDFLGPNEGESSLDRWIIDPSGGPVKEQRLDDHSQEFPRHDERLIGAPYRYGYGTSFLGAHLGGLLKHDVVRGRTEVYDEGEGRSFMEAVFVPRAEDSDEDDGWLLTFRYDRASNKSDMVILHAQDLCAGPIATISLPDRLPFGFHSNWVPA
jgi:carotenoid cleavage dioxygenase-like enzyme